MHKIPVSDTGTDVSPEQQEQHEYFPAETNGKKMELVLPVLHGVVEETDETSIFHDGDALIVSLPAVIELRVFTIINRAIDDVPWRSISYMLLDFSRVARLGVTGVSTFFSLGRIAREQNIKLLLLDAPMQIHEQLDLLMPDAFRINNNSQ